ncbi:ovomucoid-like [Liolophura sinensis]|uniref:ovomucoid-like n=1 Tax=Liolophura sinensis TaxID=3198878 RepID=UPI00315987DB
MAPYHVRTMLGLYALLGLLALGLAQDTCPDCSSIPDSPVCGTDGKTYPTSCAVSKRNCDDPKLKLGILYKGACVDYVGTFPQPIQPQPQTVYAPIDCSLWPGPREAPCPRNLDRRCGNDLTNYFNECEMCRTGKGALNTRHKGLCTDYELALSGKAYPVFARLAPREIAPIVFPRKPDCRDAFIPCPRVYGMDVCGTDGVTYSSECDLCNLKRAKEVRGETFDVMIVKMGGIC